MPINTAYLNTAGDPTAFSDQSQIAGSASTFVKVDAAQILSRGTTDTSSGALLIQSSTTNTLTSIVSGQISLLSYSVASAVLSIQAPNGVVYAFISDVTA